MDNNSRALVRNLSWQILLMENVQALPVSMSAVCNGLSVYTRSYRQAADLIQKMRLTDLCRESDGVSFCWKQENWILYNSDMPITRVRFTVAHELGHLLMGEGCFSASKSIRLTSQPRSPMLERLADQFAADLLAPACVLWGLQLTGSQQIADYCRISLAAAQVRFVRLQELRRRHSERKRITGAGCFLLSPLEQRYIGSFHHTSKKTVLILQIWRCLTECFKRLVDLIRL